MAGDISNAQLSTLLDILTHAETYAEIRDFRYPGSLSAYGPPFTALPGKSSTSPALQTLVDRFLLDLPGLRDLPEEWWRVQLQDLIENLEEANLSESYDKASVGIRKTLATAISALIEYPVRGTYNGFQNTKEPNREYDLTNADDLSRSFRDCMNDVIYGSALEDLIQKATETDNLADHTPLVQSVHEFILVNIASLMHFTLVLSPKGQYLLKLVDNANKLVPYTVIKKTLKIGNVASMISAMMRIVLAKLSVASVTNWIGLTSTQNDGQNLMQYIISTVLSWDNRDFESRAARIEKDRAKLLKEPFNILKEYASKPREQQEGIRAQSEQQSLSIVTAILKDANNSTELSESEHQQALEYLSIHLSIRDRKEIIRVLCSSHPDHLTQAVRQGVAAYEPVIRGVHNAVDLSDTVNDMQHFIADTIKISKIQSLDTIPTVGDFVLLLKKHQYSSHKFIHQCCRNGPELTGWYVTWAKAAASHFRREGHEDGPMIEPLRKMFLNLPDETRQVVLQVLDVQKEYLDKMHKSSRDRLEDVLRAPISKNPAIAKIFSASRQSSRTPSRAPSPPPEKDGLETETVVVGEDPGPGAYIARWQDLLERTTITPLKPEGEVNKGDSEEVLEASGVDADGRKLGEVDRVKVGEKVKLGRETPNVQPVLDVFLKDFRALLAEKSCHW